MRSNGNSGKYTLYMVKHSELSLIHGSKTKMISLEMVTVLSQLIEYRLLKETEIRCQEEQAEVS